MEDEEGSVVLNLRQRHQSALTRPPGSQDSPPTLHWYKIMLGMLLAGSVALKLGIVIPILLDEQCWVGYGGKCYYFSEAEGDWTYSQSQCSVLNASLAGIDSEQEKDFLLCYKGFLDRWIGLQRAPGQPWRWPNGTELDQRFPIRGEGACAFLMDENWFGSSRCTRWRRWICSKPNADSKGQGCIMESKV